MLVWNLKIDAPNGSNNIFHVKIPKKKLENSEKNSQAPSLTPHGRARWPCRSGCPPLLASGPQAAPTTQRRTACGGGGTCLLACRYRYCIFQSNRYRYSKKYRYRSPISTCLFQKLPLAGSGIYMKKTMVVPGGHYNRGRQTSLWNQ